MEAQGLTTVRNQWTVSCLASPQGGSTDQHQEAAGETARELTTVLM